VSVAVRDFSESREEGLAEQPSAGCRAPCLRAAKRFVHSAADPGTISCVDAPLLVIDVHVGSKSKRRSDVESENTGPFARASRDGKEALSVELLQRLFQTICIKRVAINLLVSRFDLPMRVLNPQVLVAGYEDTSSG
jgi:hypothetical protein